MSLQASISTEALQISIQRDQRTAKLDCLLVVCLAERWQISNCIARPDSRQWQEQQSHFVLTLPGSTCIRSVISAGRLANSPNAVHRNRISFYYFNNKISICRSELLSGRQSGPKSRAISCPLFGRPLNNSSLICLSPRMPVGTHLFYFCPLILPVHCSGVIINRWSIRGILNDLSEVIKLFSRAQLAWFEEKTLWLSRLQSCCTIYRSYESLNLTSAIVWVFSEPFSFVFFFLGSLKARRQILWVF